MLEFLSWPRMFDFLSEYAEPTSRDWQGLSNEALAKRIY